MRYAGLFVILLCGLIKVPTAMGSDEGLPFESRSEREARVSHSMSSWSPSSKRMSFIPMVGAATYDGSWGSYISNRYSLGLGFDIPLTSYLSTEIEAGYGQYYITYSSFGHDFSKVEAGDNLKLYWVRSGRIRPYLGVGLLAVDYIGMFHGPSFPGTDSYNQWIGSGQLMIGADIAVTERVSLGLRGGMVRPLFGLPATADNGASSMPYYEEAGAINTTYYRFMGAVKVSL